MQKMTDKPLKKCRKCGGRLEKQWSTTSFQLKGSGWYATDYAAKKSEVGEEKKSAEETKSSAGESVASSEKPASDKPSSDKPAAKETTKETGKKGDKSEAVKKSVSRQTSSSGD
jgi:predicted nucleic acid-binding Zn ribbon protein